MGVFGDTLRQARAQKGVTLKEAEQATRINRHHLSALEEENFAVLPPLIYQRGIVRNYATYLDLEPGKLLASFEEARGGTGPGEVVAAMRPLDMPNHWAPNFAIIAFMVVMSAIIFAWIYSAVFSQQAIDPTVVPTVPTVTPQATVAVDETLSLPARPQVADAASPDSAADADSAALSAVADAALPTATPRVVAAGQPAATRTPVPVPTVTATATATAVATVTPVVVAIPPTAVPEVPTEIAVETPAAAVADGVVGDTATIRITAQGNGVQLLVVGDGVVRYEGWLPGGSTTEWFEAAYFEVTTSDGSLTLYENADHPDWDPFLMEPGAPKTHILTPV